MGHFFLHTVIGRTIIGYLLMFVVPLLMPVAFVRLVGFTGLRHLFAYEPKVSPFHRIDPRIKILYPIVVGLLSVMLNATYVYLLFLVTLIPWILVRPSRERIQVVVTMAGVPIIGMIWSQGLLHVPPANMSHMIFRFPPTISWFGTPGLDAGGLVYGLSQAGRTLVTISASLSLLMTTSPSEIIWAFYKFRMPVQAGFAFTVALRFLPQMIERVTMLLKAIEVRGYNLSRPRWYQVHLWFDYVRRVVMAVPIITVPLLIGSLRGTSVMAMVADARAFGAMKTRTMLHEHKQTRGDQVAWIALGSLAVIVIVLVSFHIGNRQSLT